MRKAFLFITLFLLPICMWAQQRPGKTINLPEQVWTSTVFAPDNLTVVAVTESNGICYGCIDQKGFSQTMVETIPAFIGRVIAYHNYGGLGAPLQYHAGEGWPSEMEQYNNNAKAFCQAATPTHPVWLVQESSLNWWDGTIATYISDSQAIWTAAHTDGCKVMVSAIRHNISFVPGDLIDQINSKIGAMPRGQSNTPDWWLDFYHLTEYDGCDPGGSNAAAQAVQSGCPYVPGAHWADQGHMKDVTRNDEAGYAACVLLTGGGCGATSRYSIVRPPEYNYENDGTGSPAYYYPSSKYVDIISQVDNGTSLTSEQKEGWFFQVKNMTNTSQLLYTPPGQGYLEGVTPQPSVGATDNNHIAQLAPKGQVGDTASLMYQSGVFYPVLARDIPFPAYKRSLGVNTGGGGGDPTGGDLYDVAGLGWGFNPTANPDPVGVGHKFTVYNNSPNYAGVFAPGSGNYINGAAPQTNSGGIVGDNFDLPPYWSEDFLFTGDQTLDGSLRHTYVGRLVPDQPAIKYVHVLTASNPTVNVQDEVVDCNGNTYGFLINGDRVGHHLWAVNSGATDCTLHINATGQGLNFNSGTDGAGGSVLPSHKFAEMLLINTGSGTTWLYHQLN